MSSVSLDIAVANWPYTLAVKDGSIPIEGVDANFINVVPQIAAFRRMVRDVEFDVCELAPTTYMIARALGAPFIALPIFVMRTFHHGGFVVRPDAGIKEPKDLEGKKVGVRAYSVTTGVWGRGIFIDEYGMDTSKVTWVVDDEEHVTSLKLPPNVIHAPEGRSLAAMLRDGELQAAFGGNAGVGREGNPTSSWTAAEPMTFPEMFPNAAALEADWYKRTGIYPIHGTIVVKDSVLKENPWVAKSLFDAFSKAKNEWLARVDAGEANTPADVKALKNCPIVGRDPVPYGIEANLPSIKAMISYGYKQGLIPRQMSIDELFVDPEKL